MADFALWAAACETALWPAGTFARDPVAVSVSRARRNDDVGKGFTTCVKALVAGAMKPEPQAVTLLVAIELGALADRHRAT
jgi:hypothetical protein